jgi:hypothetical protein
MLHNKRTNWNLLHEQVKNTQVSLKDQNNVIQAIEYFNITI